MREWWRHPRACGVPGPKCTGTSFELGPVPGPRLTGLTSGSQRPSGPLADARWSRAPQAARGPQARAVGSEAAARDCPARRCLCADMTEPPAAAVHSTGVISGQAWACSPVRLRGQRSWGLSPSPVTPPPLAGTPVLPGAGVGTRTWSEGNAAPAASVWAGSVCGGARARARPLPWCPSPGRRGRHRRRLSGALPVPAHFTSQRPASPPLPGGAQAQRGPARGSRMAPRAEAQTRAASSGSEQCASGPQFSGSGWDLHF